jgi:hypothetical protein
MFWKTIIFEKYFGGAWVPFSKLINCINELLLKSVSKLHADTSIPRNDESWSSIEPVTPYGTMPQWVIRSASYSSSTGKCALLQAEQQPEQERTSTTEKTKFSPYRRTTIFDFGCFWFYSSEAFVNKEDIKTNF